MMPILSFAGFSLFAIQSCDHLCYINSDEMALIVELSALCDIGFISACFPSFYPTRPSCPEGPSIVCDPLTDLVV
jgi:hypothetical protein